MKALILSDVHSNVIALEAIWAREGDADAIYCAGDLVDYGVYPRETLRAYPNNPAVRTAITPQAKRLPFFG